MQDAAAGEVFGAGTSGKDERPLEVTVYVIPSDRVEQVVVLERAEGAAEPWPEPTKAEPGANGQRPLRPRRA